MLLKQADDKSKRLDLLEELQKSTMLNPSQKKWLRQELGRLRKGIQGERDSAYYLDQYFKNAENHVVLHDLRFEFEGDVAQIDHLILNRVGFIYLIETKNYAGNVSINSHGEFTADYDGDRFGVPSPIEQSRRHERILLRLMERLDIKNRTGGPLECHHVVMFHPKAVIERPPASDFDTSNVIKADQFPSWHPKFVEKTVGIGAVIKGMANMRALDTAKEWGEKLLRQHRPANQLALPEFMHPRARTTPPSPAALQPIKAAPPAPLAVPPIHVAPLATDGGAGDSRLVCLQCSAKISFAEGKYCWNNAARFKNGQYCREHQAAF